MASPRNRTPECPMKKPSARISHRKPTPAAKLETRFKTARREKSLNAPMLGNVAGTDVRRRGRVDYEKLTAQLGGKFRSMELWKLVLDRE